jgi:hypothetical protein
MLQQSAFPNLNNRSRRKIYRAVAWHMLSKWELLTFGSLRGAPHSPYMKAFTGEFRRTIIKLLENRVGILLAFQAELLVGGLAT